MSGSGIVQARRVVLPSGVRPAAVHYEDGVIVAITEPGSATDDGPVVLPGLVDTHVHINEPGRTDWEGFETATRAAIAGGTTTVCDMPLNSIPPTTSAEALAQKRALAVNRIYSDVGFWGGIVGADPLPVIELEDGGVVGFKAFLIDSGVPEFPAVTIGDLSAATAGVRRPVIIHAESAPAMATAQRTFDELDLPERRDYAAYLASRPDAGEVEAIEHLVDFARRSRTAVHVVHLSSAQALRVLEEARAGGVSITVETCPHYLTFAAEEIPHAATAFKCAPPIRSAGNRETLWNALGAGTIDMVVSDHSPSPPAHKALDTGDFAAAWGGISSLQLRLAATWTAARERGLPLFLLAGWLAAAPARLAGLAHKGSIEVGNDADLVVWDPDTPAVVDAARLEHRHPLTPYDGMVLHGRVMRTILRGMDVVVDGRIAAPPAGKLLARA